MPTPHVILGNAARVRLKEGIDLLAHLVRLTLGPRAGAVAYARSEKQPELLTSSAVIARRIVEIRGRGANVGVMMLRHALWQMHERLGDGGATVAALAHALLEGGHRHLAAGANPMLLRRGMERGLRLAVAALREEARPLDNERHLAGLAHAATGDPELGAALGDIFQRLGPEGSVTIEEYAATYLKHIFLEGVSWKGDFVSPSFIAPGGPNEIRLRSPRLLVTDQRIEQPEQLIPVLEQVMRTGGGPLLILAEDVSGPALTLLLANRARGIIDAVAAKLDLLGRHRQGALEDIAIATNAFFFTRERGDLVETADASELGRARLAQVEAGKVTIVGGAGFPPAIEGRRRELRAQLAVATEEDERRNLIDRLSRLAGGIAVLKLGASSDTERAVRKELAERFIRFVPTALEEGVVPGGGAAYLACQAALAAPAGGTEEERLGILLVHDALAAPITWIARNAGQYPPVVLAEVRRRGAGHGYDALSEQVVNMWEANILDSARVTRLALETAVSIAAMALTTDAIVLKRRPIVATTP
ncbi:MAG: chaperonin GroEL [Chloroflexi bacterium]|nr:chaperonin GroEL [Chloroflexota bacterium]